jgi:hypothetical protein
MIVDKSVDIKFKSAWSSMKRRCLVSSCHAYKNYGGRGIGIEMSWFFLKNFEKDMYESFLKHIDEYGEKETTLERIDVNGNYSKENCTWKTNLEQSNNRRNTRTVKYKDKIVSINLLAKEFNIRPAIIYYRLKTGWNIEEALTLPKYCKRSS